MLSFRTVSVAALRRALAVALADAPLLRLRFDRALAGRDPAALDDAFRCLQCYPERTRQRVADTISDWLFGDPTMAAAPSYEDHAGDAPTHRSPAATTKGARTRPTAIDANRTAAGLALLPSPSLQL